MVSKTEFQSTFDMVYESLENNCLRVKDVGDCIELENGGKTYTITIKEANNG